MGKVKKIDVILSGMSLATLMEGIKKTERIRGSFLVQVFCTGEATGLCIPPERFDEVREFIKKLKCDDGKVEGGDHG